MEKKNDISITESIPIKKKINKKKIEILSLQEKNEDNIIKDIDSINIRNIEGNNNDLEFEDLFYSSRNSSKSIDKKNNEEIIFDENQNLAIDNKLKSLDPSTSKVSASHFEILSLIGKGGYGKVYQVRKIDTNEIFAMKVLKKDFLIKTNNIDYTKAEKDILTKVNHPFVVKLHYAFQTSSQVCLIMDFINGGQLLHHLREQAMFSENQVRFYAAEIVLALEHLHNFNIIHRDIKPENILLHRNGHILLTDFGFAKELGGGRTKSFCGTLEYISPEMIKGSEYGISTDWWSLGILIYDMLTGEPPFRSKNENILQKKILTEKLKLPTYLTGEAHSIIKGFLNRDDKKRLGSNGIQEIKSHPFFRGIHWNKMLNKEIEPPFKPEVPKGDLDISNFDNEFTSQPILDSPIISHLSQSQDILFQGFSYVRNSPSLKNIVTTQV